MSKWKIEFIDTGRKARHPSNPAYPDGVDVDASAGRVSCSTLLPYPARGVGVWVVSCTECGEESIVTAAGRRDDPRSFTVACRLKVQGN